MCGGAPMTSPQACSSDARADCNLIANGIFKQGAVGAIPEGWEAVCPNQALAPRFSLVRGQDGARALMAAGNGRWECPGYIRCPVPLEASRTYRLAACPVR